MNSDVDYLSMHAVADRAIGSWLETQSPGLALSVDIGDSFFDFSARNASRALGHRHVRCPPLVQYRSHRRSVGLPVRPVNVLGEPVLFGRADGFLRATSDEDMIESYGLRVEEAATRSIDSWITGRPNLRLLHLGDPQLALDQLSGAAETLARDRPLLTLYPAEQDRRVLWSELDRHGYRAFDLAAHAVEDEASSSIADFGWIAVPAEFDAATLFDSGFGTVSRPEGPRRSALQQAMDRNALPRQRRSSALFGLSGSSSLPLARSVDASHLVAEHDCYPVEKDGTHAWRWLGPRSRSRLAVPCALPGAYNLQIAVLDCHLNGGLRACRIIAGGRETSVQVEGEKSGTIRFMGHADAATYAGYLEVDVVTLGPVASAGSDPRTLRLCVQTVTVSAWQ